MALLFAGRLIDTGSLNMNGKEFLSCTAPLRSTGTGSERLSNHAIPEFSKRAAFSFPKPFIRPV